AKTFDVLLDLRPVQPTEGDGSRPVYDVPVFLRVNHIHEWWHVLIAEGELLPDLGQLNQVGTLHGTGAEVDQPHVMQGGQGMRDPGLEGPLVMSHSGTGSEHLHDQVLGRSQLVQFLHCSSLEKIATQLSPGFVSLSRSRIRSLTFSIPSGLSRRLLMMLLMAPSIMGRCSSPSIPWSPRSWPRIAATPVAIPSRNR